MLLRFRETMREIAEVTSAKYMDQESDKRQAAIDHQTILIDQLKASLERLERKIVPDESLKFKSRIEELELWQTKVHAMLMHKGNRGQDLATPFARQVAALYGQSPPGSK